MTLGELLSSGIVIEGYRKIQCWEDEDNPTIYYEGEDSAIEDTDEYLDREIAYMFPYSPQPCIAGICIELAEVQ